MRFIAFLLLAQQACGSDPVTFLSPNFQAFAARPTSTALSSAVDEILPVAAPGHARASAVTEEASAEGALVASVQGYRSGAEVSSPLAQPPSLGASLQTQSGESAPAALEEQALGAASLGAALKQPHNQSTCVSNRGLPYNQWDCEWYGPSRGCQWVAADGECSCIDHGFYSKKSRKCLPPEPKPTAKPTPKPEPSPSPTPQPAPRPQVPTFRPALPQPPPDPHWHGRPWTVWESLGYWTSHHIANAVVTYSLAGVPVLGSITYTAFQATRAVRHRWALRNQEEGRQRMIDESSVQIQEIAREGTDAAVFT